MLADNDLAKIQEITNLMTRPLNIYINRGLVSDYFQTNLVNIAAQMSGVSMDRIRIKDWLAPLFPEKASLTLAYDNINNIHYLAAPEGLELSPFLDAVAWLSGIEDVPKSTGIDKLKQYHKPTQMLVFMADACPHCPAVVRAALQLAVFQPLISVVIVDAVRFSDLADQFKVKATPTIVVDGSLTIVGRIAPSDLAEKIASLSKPDSMTAILDSMIKSGRAEDAAELIIKEKKPEAMLPIYMSKEFSVRMGALVAFEAALEKDPRILDSIVKDLSDLLSDEEVGLRGDTAELLGKIGNPNAIPALQAACNDPNDDVREAAREALELLKDKCA